MNTRASMCIFLLSCSAAVIPSCRDDASDKLSDPSGKDSPGIQYLKEKKWTDRHPGWKQRQLALAQWQNGALDPEPILIYVQLSRPVQSEDIRLAVIIYDEDRDVLGYGIHEVYTDPNGLRSERLEEYPLFVHRAWQDVVDICSVRVHLRDAGQEKDSQVWEAYVRGEGLDKDRVGKSWSHYQETLPPIWISAPDANGVDVNVYLYDRQGHKSAAVAVSNRLAR